MPAKVKVPNIASKELVEKNMNALSLVSSKSDSPLLQCSSKIKDCNIVQQNLPHQQWLLYMSAVLTVVGLFN